MTEIFKQVPRPRVRDIWAQRITEMINRLVRAEDGRTSLILVSPTSGTKYAVTIDDTGSPAIAIDEV